MLKFFQSLLVRLQSQTLRLIILAGVLLLVWGIPAFVNTLSWWLSKSTGAWGLKESQTENLSSISTSVKAPNSTKIDCYIIFLPGVGDFSANELTPGEEFFLNHLVKLHPNCVAVADVFPYSVKGEGLGGEHLLAPLWRAVKNADGWLQYTNVLIKIHQLPIWGVGSGNREWGSFGITYSRKY